MKVLKFDLPLLGDVEISIVSHEVAEFTKRQLFLYLVAEAQTDDPKNRKNTIVVKNKKLLEQSKKFFSSPKKLGRAYSVQDNAIKFAGLNYMLKHDSLVIETNADKKPKWYKRHKKLDYSQCHIRFYNKILFPLFSLYTLLDGYYLLHGTALRYKNQNIIISGLDGVGKSSLANLLSKKASAMYADNFVLFNSKSVMPLNLAIRLDPNQHTDMRVLYSDKDLQEAVPDTAQTKPINVNRVVLLCIGEKLQLTAGNDNLASLVLFSNNAPEINAANNIITPFLYNSLQKSADNPQKIKIQMLSCPFGMLKQAMEVL